MSGQKPTTTLSILSPTAAAGKEYWIEGLLIFAVVSIIMYMLFKQPLGAICDKQVDSNEGTGDIDARLAAGIGQMEGVVDYPDITMTTGGMTGAGRWSSNMFGGPIQYTEAVPSDQEGSKKGSEVPRQTSLERRLSKERLLQTIHAGTAEVMSNYEDATMREVMAFVKATMEKKRNQILETSRNIVKQEETRKSVVSEFTTERSTFIAQYKAGYSPDEAHDESSSSEHFSSNELQKLATEIEELPDIP